MKKKIKYFISILSLLVCLTTYLTADDIQPNISYEVFPTNVSSPKQSTLLIERSIPKSAKPGEEYAYYLRVTNNSVYQVDHVIVVEDLPDNFQYVSAQPSPNVKGNALTWKLGAMAPRQKETVIIKGKAIKAGAIKHSGKAIVAYNLGSMTTVMDIVEPNLIISAEYPNQAVVAQNIPVRLRITNDGTADVRNTKLMHKFTPGLATSDGLTTLNNYIGTLTPNQSKVINLNLKASKNGKFAEKLVVKGDDGISATAMLNMSIGKPVLSILSRAPRKRFVGNNIKLEIKIQNKGDGLASNTQTVLDIPNNVKFLSANEGGALVNGQVIWEVGSVKPGEFKKLTAMVSGKVISKLSTQAVTTALGIKPITSRFNTEIAGIPAILIGVSDLNDPVPVGGYETYVIEVKNQGSLAARDIVVKCKLEPAMEYVSVAGPTQKQAISNNIVVLKPLAQLAPGRAATWKVTVKALKAGDVRFEAFVESKQLTRPVYENESTHFYND